MPLEQLGPYRIGRQLGKGGMGSVYEAADASTGQRVAVKALSPQLAMADGFRERFEAEINSLKTLQHDGIVRLYGYGEDGGILFYSMELVEGESLEHAITRGRRFDWHETLNIAIQVCRALKHAHDHGVVHRDVKPANLLLTPEGRVKIADFGIARLFGSTQLTNAGGVLGTADYMSPEQADGRPVTDKCDQYALGCVMYALLAGRPPFKAKTMPEMLQLQRFAEPESVRRYAPQTPEQLDRLITQLLSKNPEDRFPNVLVLARHMEAMDKGLSRGPKADDKTGAKSSAIGASPHDGTAAYDSDATMAADELVPLETTDSGVYTAPTLAEGGQGASPIAPAKATPTTGAKTTTVPPRTRFTTVDEDAARRQREERTSTWVVAAQFALLVATLGGLAWLGYRVTRPPTADGLFDSIADAVDDRGPEGLPGVSDKIVQFLELYPDDPNAAKVKGYADELELVRLERRLNGRGRLAGQTDDSPIADLYRQAAAMQAVDPTRAATMLDALLTLYRAGGAAARPLSDSEKNYLTLAERRLAKLHTTLDEAAAAERPALEERLAAARKLEQSSPKEAAAMYRALIALAADRPWAAGVVDAAKTRLAALGEK